MPESVIAARDRTVKMTLRKARTPVLAACCAGLLIGAGWKSWSGRRYRTAIMEIEAQMAAGRFSLAARNLEGVLARQPDSDQAAYLLGMCEEARRHDREAAQAWARVGPGKLYTHRAILAHLRMLHGAGKLASAEQLINVAAAEPRNDRTDLFLLLVPIYSQIGRSDEAARIIEDRWQDLYETGRATLEESIKLVRLHIELTWNPPDPDSLRVFLDLVSRLAPDDDRVWLGRANLAIRTGPREEARHWLDACLRRRPEDAAVWRARLNWGIAARSVAEVREAARHLVAAAEPVELVPRLAAWLSAQQGDAASERRELEKLVVAAPADAAALDRLAQLEEADRRSTEAARLRTEKLELERRRVRYWTLYERIQHVRDAEEMAHLANQLGRRFESLVFLTIALTDEPGREDLEREMTRLSKNPAPSSDRQQTLEEAILLEFHEDRSRD